MLAFEVQILKKYSRDPCYKCLLKEELAIRATSSETLFYVLGSSRSE